MSDQPSMPPYQRTYTNERVAEAYRLYVDSKASMREISILTGMSRRTIESKAKKDAWTKEREERARVAAHVAQVAAIVAPDVAPLSNHVANDVAGASSGVANVAEPIGLEQRLAEAIQSENTVTRVTAVVQRQRRIFNSLWEEVERAWQGRLEKAAGQPLAMGQLFPFVKLLTDAATAQRRAHGIADTTKLEITGKDGKPLLPIDPSKLTTEQLDHLEQIALAVTGGRDTT